MPELEISLSQLPDVIRAGYEVKVFDAWGEYVQNIYTVKEAKSLWPSHSIEIHTDKAGYPSLCFGILTEDDAIPDYQDDGYAEARESYNRQGLDLSYPQYLATYEPE